MDIYFCKKILCRGLNLLMPCLLYAFPINVNAAGAENEAVAFCIAQGAVTPPAFAYCVGKELTQNEIKKCLTGGDCFGKNNALRQAAQAAGVNFDHIEKHGICGGPNSVVRGIFGNVCQEVDECSGQPVGQVTLVNQNNHLVKFHMAGACTDAQNWDINPFQSINISGEGDSFYNITVSSPGGTVTYGLDSGMTYAFQWRFNLLDVINITPRFSRLR